MSDAEPVGAKAPSPATVRDDAGDLILALRDLGLVFQHESPELLPLTGGVSSDILLVTTPRGRFCIKRALARLKVAAVWEAPVSRNAAEAAWIRTVAGWLPDNVPELLGEDRGRGLFAMAYLPPDRHPVWKSRLLEGVVDVDFAAQVGHRLAEIHRRSAGSTTFAAAFAHDAVFESIRIEPYLRATARRHPDLAAALDALAATTLATRLALVHGDVSPKNLLCGPAGPVFLDAECAWYGDPAFDLAFCLNHLLLKGVWRPSTRERYLKAFGRLAESYLAGVAWEPVATLEQRCARLLPGLTLARVDGKSPVEYLTEPAQQAQVRRAARALILKPVERLADLADAWSHHT